MFLGIIPLANGTYVTDPDVPISCVPRILGQGGNSNPCLSLIKGLSMPVGVSGVAGWGLSIFLPPKKYWVGAIEFEVLSEGPACAGPSALIAEELASSVLFPAGWVEGPALFPTFNLGGAGIKFTELDGCICGTGIIRLLSEIITGVRDVVYEDSSSLSQRR